MNYNISFSEMNKLAKEALSKQPKVSLEGMREQVSQLKKSSSSKIRKQQRS